MNAFNLGGILGPLLGSLGGVGLLSAVGDLGGSSGRSSPMSGHYGRGVHRSDGENETDTQYYGLLDELLHCYLPLPVLYGPGMLDDGTDSGGETGVG